MALDLEVPDFSGLEKQNEQLAERIEKLETAIGENGHLRRRCHTLECAVEIALKCLATAPSSRQTSNARFYLEAAIKRGLQHDNKSKTV